MSERAYRAAVARLRKTLDLLGRYAGPCGTCGHPDQRHRQADAIASRVIAGDDPAQVAGDYLPDELPRGRAVEVVHTVTIAVLAARPRQHRVTAGRAAVIDCEVWADAIPEAHGTGRHATAVDEERGT